ncbi:giy-yig endonuclease superfamily [Holotrichia oblita]|uniref:Giy-yig endonuclease superfamily n=1 Tax=Holotrichia oblita TaxID=644536 RepID=A0ACB9SNV2_HOLOL|nr:giy-yig endonuclease superfamily [Holotrichia oblita]
MASLNFLVHRLLTLPLNKARYEKELKIIKDAAKCNGFQPQHIYKLIRKFNYKKTVKESTTFREDVKASPVVTLPYAPFITKGLSKIFKELGLRIVYSCGTSLRSLIGNPKDKMQPLEKSGIYEINCNDCNQKYIGQTRRAVSTRFKEHMANLRFNRIEKASVAQHIFETDHNIDHTNVKLIRQINNFFGLEILKQSLEQFLKQCLEPIEQLGKTCLKQNLSNNDNPVVIPTGPVQPSDNLPTFALLSDGHLFDIDVAGNIPQELEHSLPTNNYLPETENDLNNNDVPMPFFKESKIYLEENRGIIDDIPKVTPFDNASNDSPSSNVKILSNIIIPQLQPSISTILCYPKLIQNGKKGKSVTKLPSAISSDMWRQLKRKRKQMKIECIRKRKMEAKERKKAKY